MSVSIYSAKYDLVRPFDIELVAPYNARFTAVADSEDELLYILDLLGEDYFFYNVVINGVNKVIGVVN